MALLEQHPPHVRKRIAIIITISIGLVLLVLLVLRLTDSDDIRGNDSGSKLGAFYREILEKTRSTLGGK